MRARPDPQRTQRQCRLKPLLVRAAPPWKERRTASQKARDLCMTRFAIAGTRKQVFLGQPPYHRLLNQGVHTVLTRVIRRRVCLGPSLPEGGATVLAAASMERRRSQMPRDHGQARPLSAQRVLKAFAILYRRPWTPQDQRRAPKSRTRGKQFEMSPKAKMIIVTLLLRQTSNSLSISANRASGCGFQGVGTVA